LIQTAEGSMSEIESMLQRMRELVVQASNDTNQTADREKISKEIKQLTEEIDAMAGRTEFNKKKLATGKYASTALFFQIGANSNQKIELKINAMYSSKLDANLKTLASNISAANNSGTDLTSKIDVLDNAISKVSDEVAKLGAVQNRLDYTSNNLQVSSENLSSAKSRIEDADMAKEMMNVTAANVLQQAATAMLAQANQSTSQVVQLLQ